VIGGEIGTYANSKFVRPDGQDGAESGRINSVLDLGGRRSATGMSITSNFIYPEQLIPELRKEEARLERIGKRQWPPVVTLPSDPTANG
jgi:hypothetical protein